MSNLTRTFSTAGNSNCLTCGSTDVKQHKCTSCSQVMCAKCVEGHTTEFCNVQRENEVVASCTECNGNVSSIHLTNCSKCKSPMHRQCAKSHSCFTNEQGGKQSDIGHRHDMFPLANLKVAEVCHKGNKKYDSDNPMLDTTGPISPNWHKITAREHINHVVDHIQMQLSGDTSEDHIAHAACRMMFALEMHLQSEEKFQRCPNCNTKVYYVSDRYVCHKCDWEGSQKAGL